MSSEVAVEMCRDRWKQYPAYRDTGVEWLGKVPEEWCMTRISENINLVNGYPFDSNLFGMGDGIPLVRIRDILNNKTGIVWTGEAVSEAAINNGDILIGMDGDFNVSWWNGGYAMLNQRVCSLRVKTINLDQRFLFYLLYFPLKIINDITYSTTVKHLSSFDVLKTRFALPPSSEQRAIAAFLDRETGRIDTLIEKKGRQIELLQEKRAALISHAVTRGLNRDVKMKDSRVEWIGKIPEHWTLLPMKRNWQVTDCKHKTVSFIDNGIPVASIGEVKTIDVNLVNAKMTTYEEYEELIGGGRKPKRGDIIYSRNATVGAAAFVNNDVDFCMGQDVCLISSKINNQRFLIHQLLSPVVINQLESLYVGATFKRINVDQIKNFLIVCPSPKEQEVIASYCDKISQRAEILSTKIRQSLSKLREYRTALISAAVTGKIDVRSE